MVQRIRVVETVIYEYEPDYTENSYASFNVTTAQQALELDRADYETHKISIEQLCYDTPTRTAVWFVVNEST